jgi:hypothetical protein
MCIPPADYHDSLALVQTKADRIMQQNRHLDWITSVGLLLLVILLPIQGTMAMPDDTIDRYNVIWTTPGHDASDSLPLGNGVVGVNLWVEKQGDLLFYISRNDSLSEVSQLCKVGRVRVSLTPNPFGQGVPFRQELKLRDGVCEITAGESGKRIVLHVFVDSEQPVVHVTGTSEIPLTVKATVESWRTERHSVPLDGTSWALHNGPFELFESADVFPSGIKDAVVWYHRNEESPAFTSTIQLQSLESIADQTHDPLLHRTFGGWLTGEGFQAQGNTLTTSVAVHSFALRVSSPCDQTPTAPVWMEEAKRAADQTKDSAKALQHTAAWWRQFWERSYVLSDSNVQSIPGREHPLRVGWDSNDQNHFHGQIGRTGVYERAFTPDEIGHLAAGVPVTQSTPIATNPTFATGLTLEAWIKPDAAVPGRIFDRITAGGTDGFLFDTYPGDTLRFILGTRTLTGPAHALKMGEWQHVAVTVDAKSGETIVYLNGKPLLKGSQSHLSVGAAYTLQRYMRACAGRGPTPIKFNGSIFTVEPTAMGLSHTPDWRRWGDCHWWQNVRIPYHSMLAGGDFEMMAPLFDLYESVRPLCEARAKLYHGAAGCYFPETMTIWGTYANGDYSWDRTGKKPSDVDCPWWQYAWNQGPELVALMLDRWDYTQDETFLKRDVLPMAESVLTYFDTRFKKDTEGRIILDPTQSVETYWYAVVNDMPSTAGLNEITARLCSLPENATNAHQRAFFARMKTACPIVPIEDVAFQGKQGRRLAPAQKYRNERSNVENPELYAVWPFRLFGIGKPGLAEAQLAYAMRGSHNDIGWGYDGTCAALLGMTEEATRILDIKVANSNPAYRWPATWGPNFDWLPDQDHGSNLLLTTQLMLMQCDGAAIRLLPAWPKDRAVHFKLHAPYNTTVECIYRAGKIEKLVVTPESRRKDIVDDTANPGG